MKIVDDSREWNEAPQSIAPTPSVKELSAWNDMVPLDAIHLEAFPLEAFPGIFRRHAEELVRETQTPIALAAMLQLAVAGAALARKFVVNPRDRWIEPLNFFVVCVQPPGSRKSAVFSATVRPLEDEQQRLAKEARPILAQAKAEISIVERECEAAQKPAASKRGTESDRRRALELATTIEELKANLTADPRLLANDVTPEVLKSLLCATGGRLAVFSPEGDIF